MMLRTPGIAFFLSLFMWAGEAVSMPEAGTPYTHQNTKIAAGQIIQDPEYRFIFRNESLSNALKILSEQTGANILFSSDITASIVVTKKLQGDSISSLLKELLSDIPLDYIILSSGTYVLVAAADLGSGSALNNASLYGSVTDAVTGTPLAGATLLFVPLAVNTQSTNRQSGILQNGTTQSGTTQPSRSQTNPLLPEPGPKTINPLTNKNEAQDNARGIITTEGGNYSVQNMPAGTYSVTVSHVGYHPATQTIVTVTGAPPLFHEISPHPKPVLSTPVVVTSHQPIQVAHETIESYSETIEKWQGGRNSASPLQQLNLFGGVQGGLSLSDVHIQGSPRGGHRVFLDDMPVYNPYSLGTVMGAFSAMSIGDISLSKAGFKASGGSYTAGKIDLSHDLGNRRQSLISSHADFLHTHGVVHGSRNTNSDRLRIMAGYRSKLWDLHRGNGISSMINDWSVLDSFSYQVLMGERIGVNRFQQSQALSDAGYSDFHTAASYEFDAFRSLQISFYHGENDVMTDLLTRDEQARMPSYMFTSDKYKWRNIVSRIRYNWIASDRIDLSWQAGYSSNTFDHTYSMADNSEIQTLASGTETEEDIFRQLQAATLDGNMRLDENNIHHLLAKWDLHWYPAAKVTIRGGLQIDHVESRIHMEDLFYAPIIHDQKTDLLSHYAELTWFSTPSLHIMAGYRLSGFMSNQSFYLEPRFSVQYDMRTHRNRTLSFKLAGGKYHQFINQFEITNAGPNNIVPFITVWSHDADILQPEAYHLSLSSIYNYSKTGKLRMDLFANVQPVSYLTSYMMLTGESEGLAGDGEGPAGESEGPAGDGEDALVESTGIESFSKRTDFRSLGGSLRIQQSVWKNRVELLAGYDLELTRVNMNEQFGRYLPAPWGQPHRLQLRTLVRLRTDLTLIGKWSGIWGRTWAFRDVYYNYLAMDELVQRIHLLDFENPDNDTLSPFYRLDFSVSYQPALLNGLFELRADIMNVLNRRNVLDRTLSIEPDQSFAPVNRTLPGFTPSVSIGFRF